MRHFLTLGSVTALTLSVLETAATGALIAFTGGSQGFPTRGQGTTLAAIDIASIAVTADRHLAVATDTVVETSGVLHRLQ